MADWKSLPDVQPAEPRPAASWKELPDAPRSTVRDSDVADFLAGKREDVPNIGSGLPKARVESIMKQWGDQPAQQAQAARTAYGKQNENYLGTMLSALQGPSMNLTGRLAGALGGDREKTQKTVDGAVAEHPVANVVGALAGGPAGAETLGGRLLVGGLQSGVSAAARAGDGHTARDAGVGTGAGIIGTALVDGLVRGAGRVAGPVLSKIANSQALRALNPLKRDVTMLANQGIEGGVAKDLLSSGVMKPFANSANIAERVAHELEKRGAAVGAARDAIDTAAGGDVVKHSDLADGLEKLANEYAAKPVPEMQSIAADLRSRAELLRKQPVGPLSLTAAEKNIKAPLDNYAEKAARTPGSPPDKLEAMAQARRVIKSGNEAAAAKVDPELAQKFFGAKQSYGRMASIADILERNNPRALANRGLSPSDYGFGIANGQQYRPPASTPGGEPAEQAAQSLYGFIAAQLHKQVRERGNSTAAHLANVGSKAADAVAGGGATAPLSRVSSALAPYEELLKESSAPESPELKHVKRDWLEEISKKALKANQLATMAKHDMERGQ